MSAPQLRVRAFACERTACFMVYRQRQFDRDSGYLIGLELAGAKPYWLGLDAVVIGDPKLTPLYTRALKAQGVSCLSERG